MVGDIYAFHGRYWILTYIDYTKIKAYNYDDPLHQLEVSHLQFSISRKVETLDDKVSLILHKYNAVNRNEI